jgi:hypothetical protein
LGHDKLRRLFVYATDNASLLLNFPDVALATLTLHPTLVNEWKRQLADGAPSVFEKGTGKAEKDSEALVGELYKQIGQQKVELDFLARKLGH